MHRCQAGPRQPHRYRDPKGFVVEPGGRESIVYEDESGCVWIVARYAASPVEVSERADRSLDFEQHRSTATPDAAKWAVIRDRLEWVVQSKWNGRLDVRCGS